MHSTISSYSKEYCLSLETAYGVGMMSEGGNAGLERMFQDIFLEDKIILDLGCGLGGAAFYLAEKYGCFVTGLEINPWMVTEATNRIPENLKDKVNFVLNADSDHLPFIDTHFDLIYSKGVLTHVEEKQSLFSEFNRILKPNGALIIEDWLSPQKKQWGSKIQKMAEMEDLTLFAETIASYTTLLENAHFKNIHMRDESKYYATYNHSIVKQLSEGHYKKVFLKKFGEEIWNDAVEGYLLIAQAFETRELLSIHFETTK